MRKIDIVEVPSEFKLDHGYMNYRNGKVTYGRQIDPFMREDAITIDMEPIDEPRGSYAAQEVIHGATPLWLKELPRFWEED